MASGGRFTVVTGSTKGIGKSCAASFLAAGDRVIVNGRSQAVVDQTVAELTTPETAGRVFGVAGDLGTKEGCDKFIAGVDAVTGGALVEVLVSNMGIFDQKNFFDVTDEEWLGYFNVNILSMVRLCRVYLKRMLDANKGRILIISSEVGFRPLPIMLAYSTTKTAQLGFARGLAELTKGTKVTVNAVLPGPTKTEGVEEMLQNLAKVSGKTVEEETTQYFKTDENGTSLIQRFIAPEEVAAVCVFLASELAGAINGHAQAVHGGIVRHI